MSAPVTAKNTPTPIVIQDHFAQHSSMLHEVASKLRALTSNAIAAPTSFKHKVTHKTTASYDPLNYHRLLIFQYPERQPLVGALSSDQQQLALIVANASVEKNASMMLWALDQPNAKFIEILLHLSVPLPKNSLDIAMANSSFDVIHLLVPNRCIPTLKQIETFITLHPQARPTILHLISNLSRADQIEFLKLSVRTPLYFELFTEAKVPLTPLEVFDFLAQIDVTSFLTLLMSLLEPYKLALLAAKIAEGKFKEVEFLVQKGGACPTLEMAEENLENPAIASTLLWALPTVDALKLFRKAMLANKQQNVEFLLNLKKKNLQNEDVYVIESSKALVDLTVEALLHARIEIARLMIARLSKPFQQKLLVIGVHLGNEPMLKILLDEKITPEPDTLAEPEKLLLPNRQVVIDLLNWAPVL